MSNHDMPQRVAWHQLSPEQRAVFISDSAGVQHRIEAVWQSIEKRCELVTQYFLIEPVRWKVWRAHQHEPIVQLQKRCEALKTLAESQAFVTSKQAIHQYWNILNTELVDISSKVDQCEVMLSNKRLLAQLCEVLVETHLAYDEYYGHMPALAAQQGIVLSRLDVPRAAAKAILIDQLQQQSAQVVAQYDQDRDIAAWTASLKVLQGRYHALGPQDFKSRFEACVQQATQRRQSNHTRIAALEKQLDAIDHYYGSDQDYPMYHEGPIAALIDDIIRRHMKAAITAFMKQAREEVQGFQAQNGNEDPIDLEKLAETLRQCNCDLASHLLIDPIEQGMEGAIKQNAHSFELMCKIIHAGFTVPGVYTQDWHAYKGIIDDSKQAIKRVLDDYRKAVEGMDRPLVQLDILLPLQQEYLRSLEACWQPVRRQLEAYWWIGPLFGSDNSALRRHTLRLFKIAIGGLSIPEIECLPARFFALIKANWDSPVLSQLGDRLDEMLFWLEAEQAKRPVNPNMVLLREQFIKLVTERPEDIVRCLQSGWTRANTEGREYVSGLSAYVHWIDAPRLQALVAKDATLADTVARIEATKIVGEFLLGYRNPSAGAREKAYYSEQLYGFLLDDANPLPFVYDPMTANQLAEIQRDRQLLRCCVAMINIQVCRYTSGVFLKRSPEKQAALEALKELSMVLSYAPEAVRVQVLKDWETRFGDIIDKHRYRSVIGCMIRLFRLLDRVIDQWLGIEAEQPKTHTRFFVDKLKSCFFAKERQQFLNRMTSLYTVK